VLDGGRVFHTVLRTGGVLDFAALTQDKAETLTFRENAAKTEGAITIADGNLRASLVLFGNYVAAGFHLSHTAGGGTLVTYEPPTAAHMDFAVGHR